MATPLPPFPDTGVVAERNGGMSLPMRQNDEDIKREIARLEALIEALDVRVVALEP